MTKQEKYCEEPIPYDCEGSWQQHQSIWQKFLSGQSNKVDGLSMPSPINWLPILSLLIHAALTFLLAKKGYFDRFRKSHYLFAMMAFFLPFVDIIQTQVALQYAIEGNPLFLALLLYLPQGWGWINFLIGHFVFSALALFLGFRGRAEKAIRSRVFTFLLAIVWLTPVIWNIIALIKYGIL